MFIEAAKTILQESGRPMRSKEITELALKKGLIGSSKGKTPERTMYEKLFRNSGEKGGKYFLHKDEGTFILRPGQKPSRLDSQYTGQGGEHLVMSELLFRYFNASKSPVDDGMDIRAHKDGETYNIQVKTKNKNARGDYDINIGIDAFNNFRNERNVFFIFVLRESRHGPTHFIILPYKDIADYIAKGVILSAGKDTIYRIVIRISKDAKQAYLKKQDVSVYLDNWDAMKP
jgi:hypothetical protein